MTDRVKLAERLKSWGEELAARDHDPLSPDDIQGQIHQKGLDLLSAAALLSAPVEGEVDKAIAALQFEANHAERLRGLTSDVSAMFVAADLLTRLDLRLKTEEAETIERCAAIADIRVAVWSKPIGGKYPAAAVSGVCENIASAIRSLSPIKHFCCMFP